MFDPAQPFEVAQPRFDPNQPFEAVADAPRFDPSQPFEDVAPTAVDAPTRPVGLATFDNEMVSQMGDEELQRSYALELNRKISSDPQLSAWRDEAKARADRGSPLFAPVVDVPKVTASDLSTNPGLGSQVVAGVNQLAGGLAEGLLSPAALVTMGAGSTVGALQKPLALMWSAIIGKDIPEAYTAAGTAVGEKDVEAAIPAVGGAVVSTILSPMLARTALAKSGAPLTGDALAKTLEKEQAPKPVDVEGQPLMEVKPVETPVTEMREGPGAQTAGKDAPLGSQLDQLTQAIDSLPKADPKAAIALGKQWADVIAEGKDAVSAGFDRAMGYSKALWDAYRKPADYTTYDKAKGEWQGAQQMADHEVMKWVKKVEEKADPLAREAIVNFIQADGDAAVLQARADASKPGLRPGYVRALALSADEKVLAEHVRSYLDAQLDEGMKAGLLQNGIENYVTQIWKDKNPIGDKLASDISQSVLEPDFKFARKRIFDSYFDGEQAGFEPKGKDIRSLVAAYDHSFRKALTDRAFIKNLMELKASDGRAGVTVTGSGTPLPEGASPPEVMLVRPKTTPQDAFDYTTLDHPALRRWKWVDQIGDTAVMVEGDMKIHPEFVKDLQNVLGSSVLRKVPILRRILNAQSVVKKTMLSISGFHQVQEGTHAIGHGFVPWKTIEIDFKNPQQKALVDHGLQVASMDMKELFDEGLSGGDFWKWTKKMIDKLPPGTLDSTSKAIGMIGDYTDWLFQDHIPRLKMTLGVAALERNRARYAKELTDDQILKLTADQSNAAFGELNYKMMGRNKTLQDVLRLFALAPDFLEARLRFSGQSLKPYHREQLVAMSRLAIGQYMLMRIMNQAFDDDPHFEKPFSFVYKNREYGLRTVPEDIYRAAHDTRKFVYNRLSPVVGRGVVQSLTGRDDRGVKRDFLETLAELGTSWMPISLRTRDNIKVWESSLGAFGIHTKGYSATQEIGTLVGEWSKENMPKKSGEFIYDFKTDPYRPLRIALHMEDYDKAKQELGKFPAEDMKKVRDHFIGRIFAPFTGSQASEVKFRNSLTPQQTEKYKEALEERKELATRFIKATK